MAARKRPIWTERWFQRMLVVLVVFGVAVLVVPALLALIYAVRPVLLPVLIAAALAYAANPIVTWLNQRLRVPRLLSTLMLLVVAVLGAAALAAYLLPRLYAQVHQLVVLMPEYVQEAADYFEIDLDLVILQLQEAAQTRLAPGADGEPIDIAAIAEQAVSWLGVGIGVIGSTIGYVTYLVIASIVVAFCLLVFLWRWPRITSWFVPFIPASHRERTLEVLGKMDASVSGFIRGRLLQATVVAVVLTLGWYVTGVPYFLLLGIAGGLLNLIPYAAVLVWPLAIVLAWLDNLSGGLATVTAAEFNGIANGAPAAPAAAGVDGFNFWWVVFWPSVVYLIAQGLDGWVIEPLIQGKATNLDPLTVLLAVLLGGSVAGLLGLLIAIPAAACGKILAQEALLPMLRQWAEESGKPPALARGENPEPTGTPPLSERAPDSPRTTSTTEPARAPDTHRAPDAPPPQTAGGE